MVAEVTLGIYFWRIGEIKKLCPSPGDPSWGKTLAFIFKPLKRLYFLLTRQCFRTKVYSSRVLFNEKLDAYLSSLC